VLIFRKAQFTPLLGIMVLSWMTPVFLPRYPEPRKVPINPRWCSYTKGSAHEGQSSRSSNSVESHMPSHTSSAPLLVPLGCSSPYPLSSFRSNCRGPRSLRYTVVTQSGLNLRQRRRLGLIKDYELEIHYHPGKANMVADALSRKMST
jgi:hypothetical protein